LRRAAALWPDGALAHAALATHLASTGRASEALPFANHAVDLAPWNPDVVAALALAALELGKCREALLLQARAVDVAKAGDVGAAASDAKALRGQLAKYRTRCDQSQAATVLPAQ
jgi:predicted Zn-dependent protease